MFTISVDQLQQLIPGNRDVAEWHKYMSEIFPKYEITTVERVAGFVAQCAHESNNFRNLEENLNYSVDAINRVFPRYFGAGKQNAADYARNPEELANYVYMDKNRTKRGALGNTQPGDGWRFRGRGIKQLTGRNNYTEFGKSVGMTAEQAAEYVATKQGAIESACWFWGKTNLNKFADARDVVGMSRAINGGDIGLADRTLRWNTALRVLSNTAKPARPNDVQKPMAIENTHISETLLRTGSKGASVRLIQQKLGLSADGVYGRQTANAVRLWQQKSGLRATGIADSETIRRLLL
jgi:putative chitinase